MTPYRIMIAANIDYQTRSASSHPRILGDLAYNASIKIVALNVHHSLWLTSPFSKNHNFVHG
jgi:hypothetical protein